MWPPAPGLEPGSHYRLSVEFRRFNPLGHGGDIGRDHSGQERSGATLKNSTVRGRKTALSRVAKIVIAKSTFKKHHSTSLTRKLNEMHVPASKSTLHQYLKTILKLKLLSFRMQTWPTVVQKCRQLDFAKTHKNWTIQDWRCVLFSDKVPFVVSKPLTARTIEMWANGSSEESAVETVKRLLKNLIWSMMSYRGALASELYEVPRGQTVTAYYYVNEVLEKTDATKMLREKVNGSKTRLKLLSDMSRAIFQQERVPAYHARKTQDWCRARLPGLWEKGTWSGNSLDLSPIQIIWTIVRKELSKLPRASSEKRLFQKI